MSALLVCNQSEEVQSVCISRISRQNLFITLFRRLKIAFLVHGNRRCQGTITTLIAQSWPILPVRFWIAVHDQSLLFKFMAFVN